MVSRDAMKVSRWYSRFLECGIRLQKLLRVKFVHVTRSLRVTIAKDRARISSTSVTLGC